jgi:hypothetical protein
MPDQSRPAATSPDQYTLTIEEVATRYEHAGHPRTIRSIQRYCAKGHLDCLRQETTYGDKYLITPESVARHIAQIAELASATGRDLSRPVATPVADQTRDKIEEAPAPTITDLSRQDATGRGEPYASNREDAPSIPPPDTRYVTLLEKENEFLKEQIHIKDGQITELSGRARETNFLIKGLQDLFLQLQPGRKDTSNDRRRETDGSDDERTDA